MVRRIKGDAPIYHIDPPPPQMKPLTTPSTNGTDDCSNGQSCFWFSQGCTIGCASCDGEGQRYPNYDHCPDRSIGPTLDPRYRTANQGSEPGSVEDIFKYNPWRAPGKAPVFDACGMAGGTYSEVFNAGAYNTTVYARQGDLGTQVLPQRPSGTVWRRGEEAHTRWQLTAAHGGGYQYRLCPAEAELTEACFQANPLQFKTDAAGAYSVTTRFNDTSLDHSIPAVIVTEGEGGLGWVQNPLPYITDIACDYAVAEGSHCEWDCPGCGAPLFAADEACPCDCANSCGGAYPELSNHSYGADPNVTPDPVPGYNQNSDYAIEDTLLVPADLPPGDYVLGWRWDCEMSSQVWSSCADITIE